MTTRPRTTARIRVLRGAAAGALALGLALSAPGSASALGQLPGGGDGDGSSDGLLGTPIEIPPVGDIPLPDLPLPGFNPPQAPPDGPPVTEDDDVEGHETENPSDPSHASGQGATVTLADQEVAQVGGTRSEVQDDGSANSQATVLALGGQEIIGASADSGGGEEGAAGDPLAPLCEGSSGALCATLLFADAEASEDGPGSRSSSSIGVADACVGGSDGTGETCDGPVQAGVLTSESSTERDGQGNTRSEQTTSVADVCLAEDAAGACQVGLDAVQSDGTSDSRTGETERSSQVAGLELGGQQFVTATDPFGLVVPEGCTSPSLVCAFLNQGETYGTASRDLVGTNQEAAHVLLLDGNVDAVLAQSETWAYDGATGDGDGNGPGGPGGPGGGGPGGGSGGPGDGDGGFGAGDGGPQAGQGTDGGLLPNTGGTAAGLLSLALLLTGLGALLVAWSRRGATTA